MQRGYVKICNIKNVPKPKTKIKKQEGLYTFSGHLQYYLSNHVEPSFEISLLSLQLISHGRRTSEAFRNFKKHQVPVDCVHFQFSYISCQRHCFTGFLDFLEINDLSKQTDSNRILLSLTFGKPSIPRSQLKSERKPTTSNPVYLP